MDGTRMLLSDAIATAIKAHKNVIKLRILLAGSLLVNVVLIAVLLLAR